MQSSQKPPQVSQVLAPWFDRLESSRSADAALEVVRQYLASWTPQRLASMPRIPSAIDRPDELSEVAVMLVQRQYADLEGNPDLHEMAEFFAAASRRVAEVLDLTARGPNSLERRSLF